METLATLAAEDVETLVAAEDGYSLLDSQKQQAQPDTEDSLLSNLPMANLQAIYPREIAYSQSSVDDCIYQGDEEPGAPVQAWKNEAPYTIPIDVVETDNGELCTFDNRRLYAAKNFSPPEYQMVVKRHSFNDIIPEKKLETEAADLVFWWAETNGITSQLHVLEMTIIFWGVMVCYRCAYQNGTFNLNGTHLEPEIRRNQQAFTPYYKVGEIANQTIRTRTIIITNEDAIVSLRAAIESGQVVGFSKSKKSRIMYREAFNDVILRNIEGLRVTSYKIVENKYLVLKANGEKDEDYWQDQELHQLECKRTNEIERRWIESDITELVPIQSMITTLFCYCARDLSIFSQEVRNISTDLTKKLGFSVVPRDALPCSSTVVVFNAYGFVDADALALICAGYSNAVAVEDGDMAGESLEPDATGNVHVRPAWSHVVSGAKPPEDIILLDYSEDFDALSTSITCCALTRNGSPCKNRTKNKRGLCWRHHPGK